MMKLSALISALLLTIPLLSPAPLQAAQALRFGYETSQSDSQHQAAEKFKSLLEERTQGALSLRLFPDSTLGNAQAMISGVRSGSIDMEMSGTNNFAGLLPALNVLDVPFCSVIPGTPIGFWMVKSVALCCSAWRRWTQGAGLLGERLA
ncbi:Extracytoplasmic solute receptor protein yiaO [Edwardsiella tarda]|nr:Extracytoplasmic solute receptor protein yiaO [Edwardsiella tarda]